jgi:hypothetical protein
LTHNSADRLSDAIDRWLGGAAPNGGYLQDVMKSLSNAFPDVADELARERVRRRVQSFNPNVRSPQDLLLERAGDSMERISRHLTGEEYVPWPTVVGAAAVLVVAAAALIWLRRRGIQGGVGEA